jgi:hypothetical protein
MGLGHIAGDTGMEGIFAGFYGKLWQAIDSHVDKLSAGTPCRRKIAAGPAGNCLFLRRFQRTRVAGLRAFPHFPRWCESRPSAKAGAGLAPVDVKMEPRLPFDLKKR